MSTLMEQIVYRGELYRYFAAALLHRPDKKVLKHFLIGLTHTNTIQNTSKSLQSHGKAIRDMIDSPPEEWLQLTREFTFIFEGGSAEAIPLWESSYTGGENILLDASTLEVKKAYEQQQVTVRQAMSFR